MKVRPIGDKVFVIPHPAPEKIGSIYIPDTVRKQESNRGTLVATGKDCVEGMEVSSIVGYNPMGTVEVEIDGIKLLVMKESNIDYYIPPEIALKENGDSVEA